MAKRLRWLWLALLLASTSLLAAPRVITLSPHLTELAFAAGITPVAVSAWSDYPPAARDIEQVANWQGINVERILLIKPDVVLAWRNGNPQRQVDQLTRFGIKVQWLDTDSIEDIVSSLDVLQAWSPQPALAQQHARELAAGFAALQQRYATRTPKAVFLQFGQQPLFTASANTLQNAVLRLCGGNNIFADSPVAWPQVSREQVLLRQPAVIVVGGDNTRAAAVKAFWYPQLTVPVIAINDDWLSRPGPRILLAAQQLCAALQPQR